MVVDQQPGGTTIPDNSSPTTEVDTFDEDRERILDLAEGDYPGVDRDILAQLQDELGLFE